MALDADHDALARAYLDDARYTFSKQKALAEGALSQVSDPDFFTATDPDGNSIAIILKHVAGNLRSRWREFLTTDGEKPDRDRDGEFELRGETRADIMAAWERGWAELFRALDGLQPADLLRTVPIRGEPHTVLQAINRQVSHYAYHVGQIVQLAKHFAGDRWTTLSIPRGGSRQFSQQHGTRPDAPL